MKGLAASTSTTLAWMYSADAVSGYNRTWTPADSTWEKAASHSESDVIMTVTLTPRCASASKAPSMAVESISSFSTTTLCVADPMRAMICDAEPGLHTRSAPAGPGEGAAPDQSESKTLSMAATSAAWLSMTTRSRVVA